MYNTLDERDKERELEVKQLRKFREQLDIPDIDPNTLPKNTIDLDWKLTVFVEDSLFNDKINDFLNKTVHEVWPLTQQEVENGFHGIWKYVFVNKVQKQYFEELLRQKKYDDNIIRQNTPATMYDIKQLEENMLRLDRKLTKLYSKIIHKRNENNN